MEGMSLIAKSQSPSPFASHRSATSEEKTLGTTPPSILQMAPHDDESDDDESDDNDLGLSMESEKSESTTGSRRPTRRSEHRKAETADTCESPLLDDDDAKSHSSEEKRKSKLPAPNPATKMSKKESPLSSNSSFYLIFTFEYAGYNRGNMSSENGTMDREC
jgi:hypothetical protein